MPMEVLGHVRVLSTRVRVLALSAWLWGCGSGGRARQGRSGGRAPSEQMEDVGGLNAPVQQRKGWACVLRVCGW